MPYDNTFFLGHHNSVEYPDGIMVYECQHSKGYFVGVFEYHGAYKDYDYFVVVRNSRRTKTVSVIQPKEHRYNSNKDLRMVDEKFIDPWESEWGFRKDKDAAMSYYQHVLSVKDHPSVPQLIKRPRARDAQRQKVYDWENAFYTTPRNQYDHEEAAAFVYEIEDDFHGLSSRPVILTFRNKGGCYQRGLREVNIANYGMNRDIIVHEMAHWVVSNLHNRDKAISGHGPEFVGVFMLMLEKYQGYCLVDMINSAMEKNIKFVFPKGGLQGIFDSLKPTHLELVA